MYIQTFEVDLGTKPKLRRQFAFTLPPFHNVHTVIKTGHPSKWWTFNVKVMLRHSMYKTEQQQFLNVNKILKYGAKYCSHF